MITYYSDSSSHTVKLGVVLDPLNWEPSYYYPTYNGDPIFELMENAIYEVDEYIGLEGLFGKSNSPRTESLPSSDRFSDNIPYKFAVDKKEYTNPILSVAQIIASGTLHSSVQKPRIRMWHENQCRHTKLIGAVCPEGMHADLYEFSQAAYTYGNGLDFRQFDMLGYDQFLVTGGIPTPGQSGYCAARYFLPYIVTVLENYFKDNDDLIRYHTYTDGGVTRHLTVVISRFSVERNRNGYIQSIAYHRGTHFYHNDKYNCRYDHYTGRNVHLAFELSSAGQYIEEPVVEDGLFSFPSIHNVTVKATYTNIWYMGRPDQNTCESWEFPRSEPGYEAGDFHAYNVAITAFDNPVLASYRVKQSLLTGLGRRDYPGPLGSSVDSYFRELLHKHLRAGAFYSTVDAVDPFMRTLSSNWLENFSSLPSLRTGVKAGVLFIRAMETLHSGRVPSGAHSLIRALTNANLIRAFEMAPTLADAQEVANRAMDIFHPGFEKLLVPQVLYGSAYFDYTDEIFGDVKLECRSKVRIQLSESALIAMIFSAESVGLLPRLSTLWDLVPFSFVVDWLMKIGDKLDSVDSQVKLLAFDIPLIVHSFSVTGDIPVSFMTDRGWKTSDLRPLPTFRFYSRELSRHQPQLRDSVLAEAQPSVPYLTAGSLAYQVLT